ncbi:serine/threonine-protein kinase, partial [Brasilonema bromeliae]|uniref:serine/threonine-protein kinase n=1 Tax=Brasilonema bromeliae TaxID=383615 RepID=UPI001FE66C3D
MTTEINPGTLINNRYLIKKILGQGGFGRTYLALDTQRFGEACVLKEFLPATTKPEIIRKSRELFEREAKVLYQIQHPQIPKFLAWLTENERLFIVLEYIDGKNYSEILSERLSNKGRPFSETEVRAWLLDMLPVLEYIHDRKIIHRDISLENVMLRHNESKPMLIDFGVVKEKLTEILSAQSPNYQYSVHSSVVGKIGYSAPEQLRVGHCYPSSDIYSLAVSAVILLTAKMPHVLMDGSLNWQWRSYVNISDSFARILEKMLAEVPTERYQSAKEVFIELNDNNSSLSLGGVSSPLPKTPQIQTNTTHGQEKQNSETNTQSHTQTPVSLNPEFLEFVGRELTSFVGPIASVLMKNTLEQSPQIAQKEFTEALAREIFDAKKAQEFRNRLQLVVEPNLAKLANPSSSYQALGNYPAISDPEFLDRCRRELISFVGPFSSVILIKDALN